MDIYGIINNGLDVLNDNIHLSQENITLTFKKPLSDAGVDDDGNTIIVTEQIVLNGRAKPASERESVVEAPGLDSSYIMLQVNVTTVEGLPNTVIPESIRPGDIATAIYEDKGSARTYTGQFYVKPIASFSIPKIYQKIGDILVGKFEVNGNGL